MQNSENPTIVYYTRMILFDKALQSALTRKQGFLLKFPFLFHIKRIRLLLEIEQVKQRIIARENFLESYQNRLKQQPPKQVKLSKLIDEA